MKCPNCQRNILRKERTGNVCSYCNQKFAFDPKFHPLRLNDLGFQRAIEKISDNGKFYFTPQQLHFFLSRKKLKSNALNTILLIFALIVIAFLSSILIIGGTKSIIAGGFVALFWIILISFFIISRKPTNLLPQNYWEFQGDVLGRWENVYKSSPRMLVSHNTPLPPIDYPVRGLLICENYQTGKCLAVNQTTKRLGLALIGEFPDNLTEEVSQLAQQYGNLPVYILHDATLEGCAFAADIKRKLGAQGRIIDIGFRPHEVIKSKLVQFRQNDASNNYLIKSLDLTNEEIRWFTDGFYTNLFVLKPAQLIKYVTRQIEKRTQFARADNPEKQAQAIGFMTWAGEK